MDIILIGSLGKMGQLLCKKVSKNSIDQIVAMIDIKYTDVNKEIYKEPILPYLSHITHKTIWSANSKADVIIDFSTSEDKTEIIDFALLHNLPLAIFSTTCSDSDKQKLITASKHIPVLLCPNTSIGINAMFEALEVLSKKLNSCDISIFEQHHKHKLDSPSGTAKTLEKILLDNGATNINMNALRVGDECGYHNVTFFMQGEKITLSHTASSKEIFATGALDMTKKLITKANGFYTNL